MYAAYLIKEDSLSFKFKSKDNFEEMEIVAYSPQMGTFRIFAQANERPSTQNSIKQIPSWIGGYSLNVLKGNTNYCTNCYYYILLESELSDVEVIFFVKYEDTVTTVRSFEPVFSTVKKNKNHCYQYYITDNYIKENVIIQTVMFTGTATLKFKMNDYPKMEGIDTLDSSNHQILTEKIIKITPEARKATNPSNLSETGNLFVCLRGDDDASFILKILYESEIEIYQKFNLLSRGREINGYLPAGKATRYRILEFDPESDITVSMTVKSGDPKLYGYICNNIQECFFDSYRVRKELIDNQLILSKEYSIGYTLEIDHKINPCHKQINENNVDVACTPLAIVLCEGDEECEYAIRTIRNDVVHDLIPRKPHYQIIPFNQTDYYQFVIEDESVKIVNVILNTLTGNADLSLNYKDTQNNSLVKISQLNTYLPDVITIDKEKLNKNNLKGTYKISVYGASFSSYSIYYYTQSDKKENETGPAVGISLETGHIIYDIFEPDTDYKIYSFDPKLSKDLDLRITLTPEKDDFYMFVLFDLKKFVYDKEYPRKSEGFIWSDNYTNEVVISKSDPYYRKDGLYYIIVTATSSSISSKHIASFWIGATTESYPFLLYEGIPNSITLDDKFTFQTYWYTHPNISEPFSLSVNAYYGRVNVYVDFQEIVNLESKDIPAIELDTDAAFITIQPEVLKEKCKQSNNCGIFIHVQKTSIFDAQYLIVAKSHPTNAEILSNGLVRQDTVFNGEFKNYNIITDTKNLNMIYVSFITGYGEVYVNVPKTIQSMKKAKYPTREEHDYKGSDYYLGKFINIDSEKFPSTCSTCQILVTVYGKSLVRGQNEIEYSISYYNKARKINQNQPMRGNIKEDEIQYFNVNFAKNVQNVYVSLTNLNGDVDIFMNYGLDFPTMQNYTWVSATLNNEFIEFDKNHNYFVSRNQTDISGDYTIMIIGMTNSTYTLYISSHPKKIIPVEDEQPASCKSDGTEPCLFRYNEFFSYGKTFYDIIITTDFLYGSGSIYANLYKETDYEIIDEFPTQSRSDYSNVKSNTRNFLKIKFDKYEEKLTEDSMILISVQCDGKCFFDLNIAKMFESDLRFVDVNRENLFYIYKSQIKTLLVFYNWSDKNLNIAAHSYVGTAKINMYANTTKIDDVTGEFITEKNNLGEFSLDYQKNPSFNSIIKNTENILNYSDVFFEVEPVTDVGFYLKITYDQEWSRVKLNKINTFTIFQNLYVYFDMMEEYEDVVVSIKSLTKDVRIVAYVKYVTIDKTSVDDRNSQHDYTIPSFDNYDFIGLTYSQLSHVSIKLPGVPVDKNGTKFTRVLINLKSEYDSRKVTGDTKIDLTVSTKANGIIITEAEQNKQIYTSMEPSKQEYTIFDLKRKSPEDDLLVVEISNCNGDVSFKLSNILTYNIDGQSIINQSEVQGGKKTVLFNLKNYKEQDFYLTLIPKIPKNDKCKDTSSCNYRIETLLFYYTTTEENHQSTFVLNKGILTYDVKDSSSIHLKWGTTVTNFQDVITILNSE